MLEKQLSDAIATLYDAALDPAQWPSAVAKIAALTGRTQGALGYLNYKTLEGTPLAFVGFDGDYVTRHYKEILANDPWAARLPLNFAGEYSLGRALMSEEDRRKDFFVNELAPPSGMSTQDLHCTFLTRSNDTRGAAAALGALIIYSDECQGVFSDHDIEVMSLVRPHIVKALEIQARLDTARAGELIHHDLLDRMDSGLWLLDPTGRILFANLKALELQETQEISVREGVLHLTGPELDAKFHKAIHTIHAPGAHPFEKDSGAFLIPRAGHMRPLSALVMPADTDTRTGAAGLLIGHTANPAILVSISDRNPKTRARVGLVQRLYSLTPAETIILERFADGDSLSEIATQSGTSIHTVRTQLKSVMEKTQTHSQRELIAFLLTCI